MIIDENIVEGMINESSYLEGLYNVFNMTYKLIDGDIEGNIELLKKLENDIYTINNKILSDQERLAIEIRKIINVNEKNPNSKNKDVIDKKLANFLELMDEIFDKEIDENYIIEAYKEKFNNVKKDAIFSIKKKIVIIESELNIPINFFEAASYAFLDLYKKYRNMYKKNDMTNDNIRS